MKLCDELKEQLSKGNAKKQAEQLAQFLKKSGFEKGSKEEKEEIEKWIEPKDLDDSDIEIIMASLEFDENSLNSLGGLPNKKVEENKTIDDEFVDYFNSFYGPDGMYKKANKVKRPYTKEELEKALKLRDKDRKFPFEGDTTDRETLRDRMSDMKLLSLNY